MTVAPPLFERVDEHRVRATGSSRGPWSDATLHGGPVAALVGGAAERALGPEVTISRLTLDLERPVPLDVLTVEAHVVRPGRKVRVADVVLRGPDGTRLARATALGVRRLEVPLPAAATLPPETLALPRVTSGPPVRFPTRPDLGYFHTDAMAWGGVVTDGPDALAWTRLAVPVVDDEPPTAVQRAAAAADFLNGLSTRLPIGAWSFINPDLTLTLHRLPVGDWVGLRACSRYDAEGVGCAEADLFDDHGRIGRAVQNLVVEPLHQGDGS